MNVIAGLTRNLVAQGIPDQVRDDARTCLHSVTLSTISAFSWTGEALGGSSVQTDESKDVFIFKKLHHAHKDNPIIIHICGDIVSHNNDLLE